MKCLLSVCLSVLAGAAIFAASKPGQSPALQKGISVQMAASRHAAPMPEADNESAWIVTVTADGRIFFGADQVTADELTEHMKMRPRKRDAKLYIKADADAPFSIVRQVLRAARVDLFDDVVFLTSQPEPAKPGITPPMGLSVWIGEENGSNPVTVGINPQPESVRVNDQNTDATLLQGTLQRYFDNGAGRIVILKVSGQVLFAQFVQAIDASRAAGATRISILVSLVV